MFRRRAGFLVLVALVCVLPSCRRLGQPDARPPGSFLRQSIAGSKSIPSSWGNLISVNVLPNNPRVALLWFQNGAGSVRMVGYDTIDNELINVTVIERQQETAQ